MSKRRRESESESECSDYSDGESITLSDTEAIEPWNSPVRLSPVSCTANITDDSDTQDVLYSQESVVSDVQSVQADMQILDEHDTSSSVLQLSQNSVGTSAVECDCNGLAQQCTETGADQDVDYESCSDSDDDLGRGCDSWLEEVEIETDEEEIQTDEEEQLLDAGDKAIYRNAPINVNESLLLVLTYAMRHNLNARGIADLLKLITLHCRKEENKMCKTMHFFKVHFSHLKAPVIFHLFCSVCYASLQTSSSKCPNAESHKSQKGGCNYFLEVSLEHQIQALFKRNKFSEYLRHRFFRQKQDNSNIEDIYDGQLYKEHVDNGFLSEKNEYNFSLLTSVDGVPVFRSLKSSFTPVEFVINELPFKMRFKKKNMILGGIWYGSKPLNNLMLEPFVESFKRLKKGIDVQLHGSEKTVISQGILLAATADLPAKADLMGLKHTSGAYSCAVCKIQGKSVKITEGKKHAAPALQDGLETSTICPPDVAVDSDASDNNVDDPEELCHPSQGPVTETEQKRAVTERTKKREASVWVFPYSKELDLRRHDETVQFGKEVLTLQKQSQKDKDIYGVKWPTYLSVLMPDMIRGMGIDDLHNAYHGVCYKLLELWTLPKYKKDPWSINHLLELADERLRKISLPNFAECGTRSLSNLTHWKGHHVKTFVLYLALPVLKDILPDVYYAHFAAYVNCLYILNSTSISPSDLLYCSETLDNFVKEYEHLYGLRHCTINIHNTLHLSFVVNNLGPMRCFSCFPFESLNGEMLKMIHGTRYVQMQLANCAYTVLSLPHEIDSSKSLVVRSFATALHYAHDRVKLLEIIDGNTHAAGNFINMTDVPHEVRAVLLSSGFSVRNSKGFTKLKRGSVLFVSECYKRASRTISYWISYNVASAKKYGKVLAFIRACSCDQASCSCTPTFLAAVQPAIVRPFSCCSDSRLKRIRHIMKYDLVNETLLLSTDALDQICFYVDVAGDSYLCERMNVLEVE